ncbi:UNKNOWN [Stylonychia lemnae]|uniref:Uncharacterized protein n=1 Tax=Stylonychia lemnae TaxID=5949 RepID=A0A077ZWQ5_STYLE|nr:UNKNOWN [Stylonychia lemnae]|eukprot:CDW74320.1 UNKNOWN [Stylonychia lemnae]
MIATSPIKFAAALHQVFESTVNNVKYYFGGQQQIEKQEQQVTTLLDVRAEDGYTLQTDQQNQEQKTEIFAGVFERKRNKLDDISDSVNETLDYYLVSSTKAIVGGVYNGISWGVSKIFGGRQTDSHRVSLSDGYFLLIFKDFRWEDERYQTV